MPLAKHSFCFVSKEELKKVCVEEIDQNCALEENFGKNVKNGLKEGRK